MNAPLYTGPVVIVVDNVRPKKPKKNSCLLSPADPNFFSIGRKEIIFFIFFHTNTTRNSYINPKGTYIVAKGTYICKPGIHSTVLL